MPQLTQFIDTGSWTVYGGANCEKGVMTTTFHGLVLMWFLSISKAERIL